MAGERTYPVLPCPDVDRAIEFYGMLGFTRTYRQLRPNPYAVVTREDLTIHLCGIDGFDPETSVGSVIVVVPDAEALYAAFADGLRRGLGRLPSAGAPRILRPRRKQGTTAGFTVVDVGGNWLRFYRAADTAADPGEGRSTGLARVLEVAARHGDARGDHGQALAVLDRGLARHPDDPATDVVRVLLYRAELLVRTGEPDAAAAAWDRARSVVLSEAESAEVSGDVAHARDVLGPAATRGDGLWSGGDPPTMTR